MNKIFTSLLLVFVFAVGIAAPSPTQAFSIVPSECINKTGGCDICEVTIIFTNAANIMAFAISSLALLMFIIGGLMLIVSAGNQQRIETGKKILVGTVTGIVIVFAAWILVNFIVRVAYYSNNSEEYTPLSEDQDDPANIFGTAWWQQPACNDPVKSCEGVAVGKACETAACTNSNTCGCYRSLNPDGDARFCDGNAASIDDASGEDGYEENECFCATTCEANNIYSNGDSEYSCVATDGMTDAQKATAVDYTCNIGFTCIVE